MSSFLFKARPIHAYTYQRTAVLLLCVQKYSFYILYCLWRLVTCKISSLQMHFGKVLSSRIGIKRSWLPVRCTLMKLLRTSYCFFWPVF
jgi:hypothetical protein